MGIPAYVRHLILALLLIVATVNFSKTTLEVIDSSKRLDKLKNQVSSMESEKETLEKDLEYKKTEEFIEHEARNKFGYVKPGEEIFVYPQVLSGTSYNNETVVEDKNNPQLWFELFF